MYDKWSDAGGTPQSQVDYNYTSDSEYFRIKNGGSFAYNISGSATSRNCTSSMIGTKTSTVSVSAQLAVEYSDGTTETINVLGSGSKSFSKDGKAKLSINLSGSTWQGVTYSSGGNVAYGRTGWDLSVSITMAKYNKAI